MLLAMTLSFTVIASPGLPGRGNLAALFHASPFLHPSTRASLKTHPYIGIFHANGHLKQITRKKL
jgi:hypothetical protein